MVTVLLGILGVFVGLLVAFVANAFLLPKVLKAQEQSYGPDWRAPLLGWDLQQAQRVTRWMYRYPMPFILAFFGANLAVAQLGGIK